jgi:cob(I)alamin adenosyltransferase
MTDEQKKETAIEYDKMLDQAFNSDDFLIVLDEVIHALNAGLVKRAKLESVLEKDSEIVLTGGDAPEWLLEKADYISNVQKLKHPYDREIEARKGIEF